MIIAELKTAQFLHKLLIFNATRMWSGCGSNNLWLQAPEWPAKRCSGAAVQRCSPSQHFVTVASFPKESHAPGIPAEFLGSQFLQRLCRMICLWSACNLLDRLCLSFLDLFLDQRPFGIEHFKDTSCLVLPCLALLARASVPKKSIRVYPSRWSLCLESVLSSAGTDGFGATSLGLGIHS